MTTTLLRKRAADEQEAPFEQAFANLAHQYLQDKAPRLLDYTIGFQLVDRNEDNTKAIGVFGFKMGDQWLYQPVFFLNGDIKGHELLYMKDADQFIPLRENWVNYLLSRKPTILGESTHETTQQLGVLTPNMEQFSVPPGRYGKYGSKGFPGPVSDASHMAKWAKPILPYLARWQTREPYNPLLDEKRAQRLGWEDLLGEGIEHVKQAYSWYERFPTVRAGVDRFYGGREFFAKAARKLLTQELERTKTAGLLDIEPKAAPQTTDLLEGLRTKAASIEKQSLEIILREDALFTRRHNMTEEEREKLLQDGLLVRDTRPVEEVGVAYQIQHGHCKLQNPTETNVCEVLIRPQDFVRSLVVSAPWSCRGRNKFLTVVPLDGEEKRTANADASMVWTWPDTETHPETFQEWVDSLPETESLSRDNYYVAISKNGQGTSQFRVEDDLGDGKYKVHFEDYCAIKGVEHELPKSDFGGRRNQDTGEGGGPGYGSPIGYLDSDGPHVCINHKEGAGFKLVNNDLYIPGSAKLIKVYSPKVVRKQNGEIDYEKTDMDDHHRAPGLLPLGNLADIQKEIMNKTSALRVWENGPGFSVETATSLKTLPKRAALICLIQEQGLREDQAREIIKRAEGSTRAHRYQIKQALPFQGGGGFLTENQVQYGSDFPPANLFTDDGYTGLPAVSPQVDFQAINDLQSYQTDPELYNPNTVPDPMALQEAQQAADSGQKEVFDTAMLGSMLKAVREDSLIDKFLPDLMKSLDRIGRILFLFYWHGEEFEDRYGKQDMPELEDTLRNAFETVGDLTLFLKQKTVEPHGGAGGEMGEPSIEQSARN